MRESLKATARAAALLVVLPQLLSFSLRSAFMGRDRAIEGSTQWLALVPGLLGVYLRKAFLSRALAHAAPTATVSFGTTFSKAGARIDEHVYVGPGCVLGLVHIERDVLIGSGVQITSGSQTHGTGDASKPIREQEGTPALVRVGAGSWIGSGAIIMADIGANAVVGAGSVVTKPVPDSVVAAGVPAVVIRPRA